MSSLARDPGFAAARAHAPAPLAMLDATLVAARQALDPVLARAIEARVRSQLGDAAAPTQAPSERDQACLEFADQFVLFVPGITQAQRDEAAEQVGAGQMLELVRMLYAFDMTTRLGISLRLLFGSESVPAGDEPRVGDPLELGPAMEGLHAAAMLLRELDPVTTELVRLHCARYHDCKT